MTGIIILIITLATFVGIGIFSLTWGRKFRFPSGYRFEGKFAEFEAILFIDKDIPQTKNPITGEMVGWLIDGELIKPNALALSCAIAIHSVERTFSNSNIGGTNVTQVVVHIKADKNFEDGTGKAGWWASWSKGAAAYSAEVIRNVFGSTLPMAVIRSKYMRLLQNSGKPFLHELVHIMNKKAGKGYSSSHKDTELWAVGGIESIERKSEKRWAEMSVIRNEQ